MISGRLIGLNKCPGLQPFEVIETWMRLLAKCVVAVTGAEVKDV